MAPSIRGLQKVSKHKKLSKDLRIRVLRKKKNILGERSGDSSGRHQSVPRAFPLERHLREQWDCVIWRNITGEVLELGIVQEDQLDREHLIPKQKVPRFYHEVAGFAEKLFNAFGPNISLIPPAIATKIGQGHCTVEFPLDEKTLNAFAKDPGVQNSAFKILQVFSLGPFPTPIAFPPVKPEFKSAAGPTLKARAEVAKPFAPIKDHAKIKFQKVEGLEDDSDVPAEEPLFKSTSKQRSKQGGRNYRYPKDLQDFIVVDEETDVDSDMSYEDNESDGSFSDNASQDESCSEDVLDL